jgi:AcrR family transcriptional regulator
MVANKIGAKLSMDGGMLLTSTIGCMLLVRMRPRKPYHHAHLEETLLKTAIHLISEVGPAGFTLREVARRAGVSHNAPYRHFADREKLLAAVAAQGFRELTRAMRDATQRQAEPLDRLKAAGLAYIDFALRRPEHFAVMFDAPVAKHTSSDQAEAAEVAFRTLLAFVKACQDKRQLPAGDTLQFTLLAWTMVHGIAKLATAKRLPFDSRAGILKFADFVIDQSLPTATETLTKRSNDSK